MSSIDPKNSPDNTYWRSLDQLADTPEFRHFLEEEFPGGLETGDAFTRRSFMKVMGASMALLGLSGCRRPVEKIVPYVSVPEEVILGQPNYYATTMPLGLSNYGLLVTSVEGRPIKIEGNPQHPSTQGGSNTFMQAAIMGLYDPDRSDKVMHSGAVSTWAEFVEFWRSTQTLYEGDGGQGLAILSESFSSPTLIRLKRAFQRRFPRAVWACYEPVSDENLFKGIELATGQALQPVYHFDKADVILSLDSDFLHLESNNVNHARDFLNGRRLKNASAGMNRLYVAESVFSLTGAMADSRLRLRSSQITALTLALVAELKSRGINLAGDIDPSLHADRDRNIDKAWIRQVVDDLIAHSGTSLILAGRRQPPEVHALALLLNQVIGNNGRTIEYFTTDNSNLPNRHDLADLIEQIKTSDISTLIILGGNPVYNAPADLEFATGLSAVENTIHLSDYFDETSKLSTWHINRAHFLEGWGDAEYSDGTLSVIQPLIEPLLGGYTSVEFLNLLATGQNKPGHEVVQETWNGLLGTAGFESRWQQVLHDGFWKESPNRPQRIAVNADRIKSYLKQKEIPAGTGLEIIFAADASVYDGRFAHNGWLQELPDPVTKFSWENAALLSPKTANDAGMQNGDEIVLTCGNRSLNAPVWIVPGQADDCVVLPLGYGREAGGDVGHRVGFDAYQLRNSAHPDFQNGAEIKKTGKRFTLANTQDHHSLEGRPLIREANLDQYRLHPDFASQEVEILPLQSLWEEHEYNDLYQWGLVIDLNACIGCGACTLACQIENNIPLVGKKQVTNGREMHWIRVDRYFKGDIDNPEMIFQPVPCQHCEMAPCEQVCPVAATSHDEEGLNVMTYNRCVGTRYCSNNCPYKVRRFNFFNYIKRLPKLVQMAQNPDVTVRSRGVMEKCSFCLQRINRAKKQAKMENRPLRDGEILTACQQACPTGAIVFGNLKDPDSAVVRLKKNARNYEILAEFNTRPRTSYLAKIRNRKI